MNSDFCVSVVIPVLNGGDRWKVAVAKLLEQEQPVKQFIVLDSGSSDGSRDMAVVAGFEVYDVAKGEFDHGGTRQVGIGLVKDAGVVVFLTQDAVLEGRDSLARLVSAFEDPKVAVAYGRQLPKEDAKALEAHARLFNYPGNSECRVYADKSEKGIKTAFTSDSYCAYRLSALQAVGGFPSPVISGEDMIVSARTLMAGWRVAYVAESCVLHSHTYTSAQELRRYFDIGVMHSKEAWLLDEFGGANGEGARYVMSELRYAMNHGVIPTVPCILHTACKYLGYKLGRMYERLPSSWIARLTMNKAYWKRVG